MIIANEVARDSRLSYRARGVLLSILSRPDGWRTTSEQLASDGKEGRDAIRSALRELADAGYIDRRRERVTDKRGRKVWVTETWVRDQPPVAAPQANGKPAGRTEDGFPGVGNPGVGNPGVGNPGPIERLKERSKEQTPPSPADACDGATDQTEAIDTIPLDLGPAIHAPAHPAPRRNTTDTFEAFWAVYPRKVGKAGARAAYERAVKATTPDAVTTGAARYAAKCTREHTEERFIAHPATWLRAGRWDDVDTATTDDADERAWRGWGSYREATRARTSTPTPQATPGADLIAHLGL